MATAKSIVKTLGPAAALVLAGCASPNDGRWPTVSFGHEIEAMEAAEATPTEVALAPLPGLSEADKAGLENPEAYIRGVDQDLSELTARMTERRRDYAAAVDGIMQKNGDDFRDAWLTAEMELSNISQLTESLARLRARLDALGSPLPERARVLLSRAEALELQARLFVRDQKAKLFQIEPT